MLDLTLATDLLKQLPFAACVLRRDYQVVFWNDYFADRLELPASQVEGHNLLALFPQQAGFLKRKIDSVLLLQQTSFTYWEQRPHIFPLKSSRPVTGTEDLMYQNMEIVPVFKEPGLLTHLFIVVSDATATASYSEALKVAHAELAQQHQQQLALNQQLEQAHLQLLQSEKMASIGQLAAGVAHEINNPIGFISSNLQTMVDYCQSLTAALQQSIVLIRQSGQSQLLAQQQQWFKQHNIDYIQQDIHELVSESLEGAERVMSIVKSLREFSHVDSTDWKPTDLVLGMESTLRIIHNELKYKVTVHQQFQHDLPLVYCQSMQINQVFMNIIVNAAQAIETQGDIWISISQQQQDVWISIKDNGSGIASEHLGKLFDPFFTTKPVGTGTGLGLSVSYSIIQKHQGDILVCSEPGKGTEFRIRLPVRQPELN